MARYDWGKANVRGDGSDDKSDSVYRKVNEPREQQVSRYGKTSEYEKDETAWDIIFASVGTFDLYTF